MQLDEEGSLQVQLELLDGIWVPPIWGMPGCAENGLGCDRHVLNIAVGTVVSRVPSNELGSLLSASV